MKAVLEAEISELAEKVGGGPVGLWFVNGTWSVIVTNGRHQFTVPGTCDDDPVGSVRKALERWENRSAARPFREVG